MDDTNPLQPLKEDAENATTMSIDAVSGSPPPMVPQISALKLQLFELLKSADIQESDIKDYTTIDPMQKQDSIPAPDDQHTINNKRENQLNSHYDKQILLEEAEMIHRLQQWIQKKGKPAIHKVHQLTMKTDQYEQEISSANLELKALRDEINKINKEKHDLNSQYEEEKHRESELLETIETLHLHTEHNSSVLDSLKQEIDGTQTGDILKQEIDKLNTLNTHYKKEIQHINKVNQQYMEQNSSLKTKIETKDAQIKELSTDRDEWQSNAEKRQSELLERFQEINHLNTENANYKHQIELLSAKTGSLGELGESKTLRGFLPQKSTPELVDDPSGIQPEKSKTGDHTFIYGASTTAVMGHGVGYRDSMDDIDKQLKEERNKHETEMETLTVELEELRTKVDASGHLEDKYKQDIKVLNEEIERLKEQNAEGCNGCNVM